jgi:hypothetical protein
MIETFALAYLIIGTIFGLVVLWTTYDEEFDDFVREEYNEEPPTHLEKWGVLFTSPFLWPLYIWKMFNG